MSSKRWRFATPTVSRRDETGRRLDWNWSRLPDTFDAFTTSNHRIMEETRKKLTDVQLNQLLDTQTALATARAAVQKADLEAQRVVALVFDAHRIPQDWLAEVDQETGELVCRPAEQPAVV